MQVHSLDPERSAHNTRQHGQDHAASRRSGLISAPVCRWAAHEQALQDAETKAKAPADLPCTSTSPSTAPCTSGQVGGLQRSAEASPMPQNTRVKP